MRTGLGVLTALALASAARAEVTDRSPIGFETRNVVTIAAPPAKVQAAMLEPAKWWNKSHSWSGDAANLYIDKAAGCFCEKLPNGGLARHMAVVYVDGTRVTLSGGLGPLSTTGATGHLSFGFKPVAGGTETAVVYRVGGYAKGGLAETWAGPVDGVLAEQLGRLKRYVETGKPE